MTFVEDPTQTIVSKRKSCVETDTACRRVKTQAKKVSNATVDHDFTYLKSALMCEYKKTPSRIAKVPHIRKSGEDKVRSGFLEFEGYEEALEELPMSLKCIFVVSYHIGNRKGALLEL